MTAYATESGFTLACMDSGGKGKEIPTIKNILDFLTLKKGDIITIDAIGCQKNILRKIKKQKADYLIALKKNQGNLHAEAENFFLQAFEAEEFAPVSTRLISRNDRGRKDQQKTWVTNSLDWLPFIKDWPGLSTLICMQRTWSNGKKKCSETRYYISSLRETAERMSSLIRRHWAIENECHWHLDVNFGEDDSEIKGRSNKILRVARLISLQLLKRESTTQLSIKQKKRKCHRSEGFLTKVLLEENF